METLLSDIALEAQPKAQFEGSVQAIGVRSQPSRFSLDVATELGGHICPMHALLRRRQDSSLIPTSFSLKVKLASSALGDLSLHPLT